MLKKKVVEAECKCCEICENEIENLDYGYSMPFYKIYAGLKELTMHNSNKKLEDFSETRFFICNNCAAKYGKDIAKVLLDSFNDTIDYIKQNQGDK